MGYWLLDHHVNLPDGKLPWYTTRRRCQHGIDGPHLITIHTPETLADFTPPYDEAERVAQYGATITRASWHDTIDADSIIPMLPPEFTAWHVRGFNRCAIGMEIGAKATTWTKAPAVWVTGVLDNASDRGRQHSERFDIPPRKISQAQLDVAIAESDPTLGGFVGHRDLDPSRRSDPGADFPWTRFLNLIKGDEEMTPTQARIEVATAWYQKAGVWMDGTSAEDPQKRLTRLAGAVVSGERTVADIVQFAGRVRNPQPGEAVPAWVLDPTAAYAKPIYGGGSSVDSLARSQLAALRNHLRKS